MPKKISQVLPRDPEMSYKGTKGGAPGGKEGKPPKAALRYAGFLNLKRLTPAGVGGFRAHFWRPFGTLWAHFGGLLA